MQWWEGKFENARAAVFPCPNNRVSGGEGGGVFLHPSYWLPLQQIYPCCGWIANRIPDPHIAEASYCFQISQSLQMTSLDIIEKPFLEQKSTNQAQRGGGEGGPAKISTNLWPIPCLKLNTICGWSRKYFPRICRLQIWVCSKLIHPLDLTVKRWRDLKLKFGTPSM